MSAGDKLFVPSGGAVSWRATGGGKEKEEAIAVRFCYVDASNFNSVKSHLPLYAAVEVRRLLRLDQRQSNATQNKQQQRTNMTRIFVC